MQSVLCRHASEDHHTLIILVRTISLLGLGVSSLVQYMPSAAQKSLLGPPTSVLPSFKRTKAVQSSPWEAWKASQGGESDIALDT